MQKKSGIHSEVKKVVCLCCPEAAAGGIQDRQSLKCQPSHLTSTVFLQQFLFSSCPGSSVWLDFL